MSLLARAQTRLSLVLMGKGFLLNKTAPVSKGLLISTLREHFPDEFYGLGTKDHGEIIIQFCNLWDISLAERRNRHLKELDARLHGRMIQPPTNPPEAKDEFLNTFEWRRLRMQALKKYGPRCQCCGATTASGAVLNVDHIKPRRLYPELALSLDNLQVLCHECNHGKGNWDMTDWRVTEGF